MTRRATAAAVGSLVLMLGMSACEDDIIYVDDGEVPAAPTAIDAWYYAYVVNVTWELGPGWDEDPFRIYSRRVTDSSDFLIAEVTSCADGVCSYQDTNVAAGETYEYYVVAVSPTSGNESSATQTVSVFVPMPTPPPVPNATLVIALDDANYLSWGNASRGVADFSHYKVYQELAGESLLLGETDSEGFLDLLAANGETYGYFVTAVDADGHESQGSPLAEGTPRPDFAAEFMYDHFADPTRSGFRFQADETTVAVGSGNAADNHFRFETDVNGWWLVPMSGTEVLDAGFTTALKCGVAADASCTDVSVAPSSGYSGNDVSLVAESSYVLRVVGDDLLTHYGVIRVSHLGFDQAGDPIVVFDWAYQLQAGNPQLVSPVGG
jgi:hypothetical protein